MKRRIFAIVLLAALIAPVTWVHAPLAEPDFSQSLTVTPIETGSITLGDAELVGAWHLESPNSHFGSYSSLLALPDCTLFSASDAGKLLRFPMPGCEGKTSITRFAGRTARKKALIDIESLTRDPETGRIWVGYEGTNTIERLEGDLSKPKDVRPAGMRGWSSNSGPEALVRLANGYFIVISEGRESYWGSDYPALLFEGDPVEEPGTGLFRFEPPAGYRPVDMAQLPDGRVLILLRKLVLGLPPTFHVKLVLADPADIAAQDTWRGQEIATITDPKLADNYEGLAIAPREDHAVDLWLISDDNNATIQRTLLLKLKWRPEADAPPTKQKARGNSARRSEASL